MTTLSKTDRKRIVNILKNRGFTNPQKMSTDRLFKKYESTHPKKTQNEKNRERRIRKKI